MLQIKLHVFNQKEFQLQEIKILFQIKSIMIFTIWIRIKYTSTHTSSREKMAALDTYESKVK